jgi:iron complex outermembrane receptor protein
LQHWGVDAEVRYEIDGIRWLGDLELVALGGAEWRRAAGVSDADGSDWPILDTERDDETVAGTFDLRALTSNAEYVNWIVGFFFYQHTLDRTQQTFSFLNIPSLPLTTPLNIDSTRHAQNSGFAPYFNINITPFDWLEIFGGFRWNQDKIEVDEVNFDSTPLPLRPGSELSGSQSFGEPTGEIGVKSEWMDGKIVYAKFARGYKAGNIELRADGTINMVEPEVILSIEAATKNRFFDNRLHLNLTGFYYDYSDLQVPLIQGLEVVTKNAAQADIWGLELETVAKPIGELYVNFSVSYLHAEFGKFCSNDAAQPRDQSDPGCPPPTNPIDGQIDLSGNRPEDTPSWKITLLTNYKFDLEKYGTITPILKFTFTDQYFLRPFNCGPCYGVEAGFANPQGIDNQPWFTRTDIRLQWRSESGYFFGEVFVENIEDNSVYQRVVVGSQLNGGLGSRFGFQTPRIYGGRFGISFEGI